MDHKNKKKAVKVDVINKNLAYNSYLVPIKNILNDIERTKEFLVKEDFCISESYLIRKEIDYLSDMKDLIQKLH